ncbi:hypothetical protein OAH62_00660 [Candidatus Marinimicrobia bacterium]|nr:hypothetical protein [Candidatus Neomarinimicrobiota bacterium]
MKLLFSSIGKKIQVALSGLFLSIFLFFHLMNNLVLIIGPEEFNNMVYFLESIKPIIRVMEVGLVIIILLHVVNAIQLTFLNKKSKGREYQSLDGKSSSTNSRTMAISGTIILSFIIIHLSYMWWTYQNPSLHIDESYYDVILRSEIGYLNHLPTAIFYIISIVLIGSHLRHGFQSALKTLGFLNKGISVALHSIGFLFWAIIPLGFILIIILIQIGYIR